MTPEDLQPWLAFVADNWQSIAAILFSVATIIFKAQSMARGKALDVVTNAIEFNDGRRGMSRPPVKAAVAIQHAGINPLASKALEKSVIKARKNRG
ncbi:MAG: hypothetical protein GY847_14285 [Proteobacteria bacterium]|nr:hypothetical protein [Pseudomonadota bacterium]